MKVVHCDICGKEIKNNSPWTKESFCNMDGNLIEDVCDECYKWIYCCINMMKETGWRPDFHEKFAFNSTFGIEKTEYVLSDLENQTGLKLM